MRVSTLAMLVSLALPVFAVLHDVDQVTVRPGTEASDSLRVGSQGSRKRHLLVKKSNHENIMEPVKGHEQVNVNLQTTTTAIMIAHEPPKQVSLLSSTTANVKLFRNAKNL